MNLEALAGQRVGSYRLDALLGSGGFGSVYRAVAVVGGQEMSGPVAVKLIPAAGPETRRTLRELENAVALRHDHVVATIGHPGEAEVTDSAGERGWVFWFAMELADGSLSARLRRGPLGAAELEQLAQHVGAALLHLHRLSPARVHRDVKPANILRVGGVWKLADLGLTRTEVAGYVNYSILATLGYEPPEAHDGGVPLIPWDVWAFGMTLLEAATGRHPAAGTERRAWLMRLIGPEPLDLPSLPSPVEGVVRSALAKDPARRPGMDSLLSLLSPARPEPSPGKAEPARADVAGRLHTEAEKLYQAGIRELFDGSIESAYNLFRQAAGLGHQWAKWRVERLESGRPYESLQHFRYLEEQRKSLKSYEQLHTPNKENF